MVPLGFGNLRTQVYAVSIVILLGSLVSMLVCIWDSFEVRVLTMAAFTCGCTTLISQGDCWFFGLLSYG